MGCFYLLQLTAYAPLKQCIIKGFLQEQGPIGSQRAALESAKLNLGNNYFGFSGFTGVLKAALLSYMLMLY